MDDDQIKITPQSPDFQTELAKKISELVPEAMSDGKLDVNKLRELVNGDAETSPERFGLFWPGKARAQAVAQLTTTATLKPAKDESVDWDTTKNIFIEGDNLEVLKALQNSYRRKVKMIYIDPPYNTGKEFIYPDNFQEGLKTYLEYTGQTNEAGENTESKKETGGRKHSNWLSMMYPRLQLAKSLLTKDGVIFISIGDHEIHNLKQLCNEIFGEENFEGLIHWRRRHNQPNDPTKLIGLVAEHILVYARNSVYLKSVGVGKVPLTGTFTNPDNDPRGAWNTKPWKIGSGQSGSNYRIITPTGKIYDEGWMGEEATFKRLLNDNRIVFPDNGDGAPRKKIFEAERLEEGQSATNWFPHTLFGSNQDGSSELAELFGGKKKIFDNPKPTKLLMNLLRLGNVGSNDVVMDFFAGSGSTADALMQYCAETGYNINIVTVQLPEVLEANNKEQKPAFEYCTENNMKPDISEVAKDRIRRAGKKVREDFADEIVKRDTPLDTGFRVYKLAASNFAEWNEEEATNDIQQAVMDFTQHKKPDATPEDLLTEIMLRSRVPLDATIDKKDLENGSWVYVINGGNLIAYVADQQLTVDQASEIADMAPGKFVALDTAFNDNDSLKINIANICKEKHVEFRTI